jgi:hypothetical protein
MAVGATLKLVEKSNVPFHSWEFAERKNASLDAAKRGRRCNYRQAESERFGLKLTCPDAWFKRSRHADQNQPLKRPCVGTN